MPNQDSYKFYQAYVINVRDFVHAETEVRRIINRALKNNKQVTVKVLTKVYALLYSTYSEASFMKMILTPHGFEQEYVDEILKQESIQDKWLKCLEISFLKFVKRSKGSEVPNKKLDLEKIIRSYVIDPSILRNKIAHGQLTIALNRMNTNLNPTITDQIKDLDFITVYRWFEINKKLCAIIEDLIESPDKAHYDYYYSKYQTLDAFIKNSSSWTVESKLKTISMQREIKYLAK
jgi:hypothetical protein